VPGRDDLRRPARSQLDDNLQAVDVALTADDLKALGEVSAPSPHIRSGRIRSDRIGVRERRY